MLWLDASDSGTITHSGGAVSQWDDKSGNANHAVQETAGMKPTTNSVTLNGLNVLSFDGGDSMTCTSVDLTGGGQKFTVFAVFSASTGGYQFVLEHTAEYSANPGAFVLRRDGVSDAGYLCKQGSGIRSSCSTASSITAAACLSATHDGTLSTNETTVWRNGTAGTLRTWNDNTNSDNLIADMLVGGRPSYFLNGTIAEAVVYASLLSTSDRQAIESYLTDKWLTPHRPAGQSSTRLQAVNRAGSW